MDNKDLHVPDEDRIDPYRIVFDFECTLEPIPDPQGNKLKYTRTCKAASVSIAHNGSDNPDEFSEPTFLVDEDPAELIRKFYEELERMSILAAAKRSEKFQPIIQELEAKRARIRELRQELRTLRQQQREADIEEFLGRIYEARVWEPIISQFERCLKQTPVIGFNSGSLDLNLIRRYLIPYMLSNDIKIDFPVVRGSSYMLFPTEHLLFLDITNYLAAGTSYHQFLKAFNVDESKGTFCYEWFTSVQKLFDTTELPPQEEFWSELKNEGISDADYQSLQDEWVTKGFRSMRDFLEDYNNRDVDPFLIAISRIHKIFADMGFDMFKDNCISLPGLAQKYMMKDMPPDTFFCLFGESHRHLRKLIMENIVGGPATVFCRLARANVTCIGVDGPLCRSVEGFDANGLYLGCTGKLMPSGIPGIWTMVPEDSPESMEMPTEGDPTDPDQMARANEIMDNNKSQVFKRDMATGGKQEIAWVTYKFKKLQEQHPNTKLTLQHRFHGELGIILQYHGCYYHGHTCDLTTRMSEQEKREKDLRTRDVHRLLEEGTNHELIEMRECELYQFMIFDKDLHEHYENFKLPLSGRSTAKNLIDDIRDGTVEYMKSTRLHQRLEVFGIIEVPWWDPDLRHQMKEFPPIFKNTNISRADIGPYMRRFAQENNIMTTPRRSLISSYHAKKIMLATPYLRMLLQMGLAVTRVYQFIQYTPKAAFSHLVDEITDYRRRADLDPNTKPLADTYKKIGNSMYGKFLTRLDKHLQVDYAKTNDVQRFLISPLFRKLVYLGGDVFEVHMAKMKIIYNLPIEISFFVYQYAKMRMVDFYYDFLLQVIPNQFELLEMDTDSLYFSLSAESLEEAVPHDCKEYYEQYKAEFLPQTDFDLRTPLLFKQEYAGDSLVCLNPKTYMALKNTQPISNVKLSSKGISKRTTKYTNRDYLKVIRTKEGVAGRNMGFRMHKTQLCQYSQVRNGLGFFYGKRKVLPDGIHTIPLSK